MIITIQKSIITFIALYVLLGMSPSSSHATSPDNLFTLDNGLTVYVVQNHKVPAVSHSIWYRVGGIDEPIGKSGIAQFFEHLMFKGTETVASGEFSKVVTRNGGNDNAFTTYDLTAYYQNIASDKLGLVMKMEADRMTNLTLEPREVTTERDVVLEERRTRIDRHPRNILLEQMRASLFLRHPYRRPLIGWQSDIKDLDTQDALAFYKQHYAPNNAVLIVSGDVTVEEVKELAQKYYGVIPARELKPREFPAEPSHSVPRTLIYEDAKIRKPELISFYLAPSLNYGEQKHVYALELLARILGGSQTSRLYQELVVDKQLAASAETGYNGLAIGPAIFSLYLLPNDGVSLEQLQAEFNRIVQEMIEQGITEDETRRSKNVLKSEAIYAKEGLQRIGHIYGSVLARGISVDYIDQWEDNIESVTEEDLIRAAKHVIQEQHSVTGILRSPES
ncbi:MAG: insulinase family protein [Rickettsiales bacterium]|nr:insulinase family protein [Rickettsiales bacterium]